MYVRHSIAETRSDIAGNKGFTLIELMIVIAIIAIILALALPVYSNYTIRSKIGEGLSLANAAKTAVSAACSEDRTIPAVTNTLAGYAFLESEANEAYVANIQVGGPCVAPVITVTTKNTGATPDPVLLMTGNIASGTGQIAWRCSSSNTPDWLLPTSCRS